MNRFWIFVLLAGFVFAEDPPALQIFREGMQRGEAYSIVKDITGIGPRLSGSKEFEKAVEYAKQKMLSIGLKNVRLQPVLVPHWVRGERESAQIVLPSGELIPLSICALGGSVATPKGGIVAEVLEVHHLDELKSLGDRVRGKIIFFNRPMDPTRYDPFEAYGAAVDQRSKGTSEAAKYGAVGVLVRSMTMAEDDVPHTGSVRYQEGIPKIPAAAVGIISANRLSALLKESKPMRVKMILNCKTLSDVSSANVIGELVGSKNPQEIVLVGAHLDSWDKGTGAHDDAAGCAHVLEAARLLIHLGLQPERTIRFILFANEENGLRGAITYAEQGREGERHLIAMESDSGGFTPRGFSVEGPAADVLLERLRRFYDGLALVGATNLFEGESGADLNPLVSRGIPGIGLRTNPHRYFDYHHTEKDTLDKVHPRELQLGAVVLAILSYELAQNGL